MVSVDVKEGDVGGFGSFSEFRQFIEERLSGSLYEKDAVVAEYAYKWISRGNWHLFYVFNRGHGDGRPAAAIFIQEVEKHIFKKFIFVRDVDGQIYVVYNGGWYGDDSENTAKTAEYTSQWMFSHIYEVSEKEAYVDLGELKNRSLRIRLLKELAVDFYIYVGDDAQRYTADLVAQALRNQATRDLAEFLPKRLQEVGVSHQIELDSDRFYILTWVQAEVL